MNAVLIEKIIKMYNANCPAFEQENPLLNKDVAKLLASSYVKLLKNSEITSEFRELLLQSIRTSCRNTQTGHLCIDDDQTEIILNCYEAVLKDLNANVTEPSKVLETFLIRHMKEMNINPINAPSVKPDIIQAMNNLKGSKKIVQDICLKDIIHWNVNDKENNEYVKVLKQMWNVNTLIEYKTEPDDISIKIKPDIEKMLLKQFNEVLNNVILDLDDWFTEQKDLCSLVEMCGVSSECFQICTCIMNAIFIMKSFNRQILLFIKCFIAKVKLSCLQEHFFLLYPINLRHIVALVDIDSSLLPEGTRKFYTRTVLDSLHRLHNECENDVIMLLSHFDEQWFQDYYNDKMPQIETKMETY